MQYARRLVVWGGVLGLMAGLPGCADEETRETGLSASISATGTPMTMTSVSSTTEMSTSEGSTGSTGEPTTSTGSASGTTAEPTGTDGSSTGPSSAVCGDGVVGEGEDCDDGNKVDNDTCSNACKAVKQATLVGMFTVSQGPAWANNPPTYTCKEACALIFGGLAAQYACSINNGNITGTAYLDGWGDTQYCNMNPQDDDFKKAVNYNCGAGSCSFSAYVSDHGCAAVNYCWKP